MKKMAIVKKLDKIMNDQQEVFTLTKAEAMPMLVEKEVRRMQLQAEIEAQRKELKAWRDELKQIKSHIDQLTVVCNGKG